jgi:mono/diheme cytochrome c family protein
VNGRAASAGYAVSLSLVLVALVACDVLFPHRTEGEKLWRQYCADCHGLDGAGNTPRYMGNPYADLTDDHWKDCSGDDAGIESVIHDGVFAEMPENTSLSRDQMKALIGYIHVLRHEKPAEATP